MNKTIENLSSAIRDIAAQEAEKHTDIVIGEIAEKNSDGTYDVFIVPDFVTPVTNIPNSSIYDFNIGEGCYIRKYNNQLQSSAIVDKIGFSQPRFGKGGEGLSSVSGSLVAGKTSELQNDGSDGIHPFIDTSALLQSNPMFYPSTSEDKIFSAKAVSSGFTVLTEQVAEALDTKVAVNEKQDFTDSQKRRARTNIGAASQGDIEGINSAIGNCVQVVEQTFSTAQQEQARTNIGAVSNEDLAMWMQRLNNEEDLNTLANVANGKAYISRYDINTANTPAANTYGNVISFRNSGVGLTQLAMGTESGKIYFRASGTAADCGTWKEVDTIAQKTDNYIIYTSGLKIQWGITNSADGSWTGEIKFHVAFTSSTSYVPISFPSTQTIEISYSSLAPGSVSFGRSTSSGTFNVYWIAIGY